MPGFTPASQPPSPDKQGRWPARPTGVTAERLGETHVVRALRTAQRSAGNRAIVQLLARRHPPSVQRGDPHMELGEDAATTLVADPKTVHERSGNAVTETDHAFVVQGLNETVLETLTRWRQARTNTDPDSRYVLGEIVRTGREDLSKAPDLDPIDPQERLAQQQKAMANQDKDATSYLGLTDQDGRLQSFASFGIVAGTTDRPGHLVLLQLGSNPAQQVKYAGRELVRQLALLSQRLGLGGRIRLQSFRDAVDFYRRLGFVEIEEQAEQVAAEVEQQVSAEQPEKPRPTDGDTTAEGRIKRLRERIEHEVLARGLSVSRKEIDDDVAEQAGIIQNSSFEEFTDEQAWENTDIYLLQVRPAASS